MEYTRIEIRFVRGGCSRATRVAGAVAGQAVRAVIDPTQFAVTQTLMPRKSARQLPELAGAGGEPISVPQPEGALVLSAATHVHGPDGTLGMVSRVWVARATGRMSHLLIRARAGIWLARDEYVLSAELVESIGHDGVTVKPGPKTIADLPLYRSDDVIASDVRLVLDRVLADPRARRGVKLLVDDGHVTLAGEVDTVDQVQLAERAATVVSGVRGTTVDLIPQEALAGAVEACIAPLVAVASNGHGAVRVLTEHGIVYLEGSITSKQAREEIERAALTAAGARVVVNNLLVGGSSPNKRDGTGPLVRNR